MDSEVPGLVSQAKTHFEYTMEATIPGRDDGFSASSRPDEGGEEKIDCEEGGNMSMMLMEEEAEPNYSERLLAEKQAIINALLKHERESKWVKEKKETREEKTPAASALDERLLALKREIILSLTKIEKGSKQFSIYPTDAVNFTTSPATSSLSMHDSNQEWQGISKNHQGNDFMKEDEFYKEWHAKGKQVKIHDVPSPKLDDHEPEENAGATTTVATDEEAGLPAIAADDSAASTVRPLRQSTNIIKHHEEATEEKPGAYRMESHAGGAIPAWVRNSQRLSHSTLDTSQESTRTANDQSHLPPEMRSRNEHEDRLPELELEPSSSTELVMTAEVSQELPTPTDSKKQSKRTKWIVICVVMIIVAIGLGVGFSGLISVNEMQPNEDNETNEQNIVETLFVFSEKCLSDGSLEDMSDKEMKEYRILKEELFTNNTYNSFDDNMTSCEAPNLALRWLVEESLNSAKEHNDSLLDRYALATCFFSWTKGELYELNNATEWMTGKSVCAWFGIACDDQGFVAHINLKENHLLGSIPAETALLSQLVSLDLEANSLTGTIPTEIGSLESLVRLNLKNNIIDGYIPKEIGQLKMLRELVLSSNQLMGSIPTSIGSCSELRVLDLGDNNNMNDLMIPSSSYNRPVMVGVNNLAGSIPTEIGQLTMLEVLVLSSNQLIGSIPTSIGSCSELRLLDLAHNKLNGMIPSEIGLWSNLQYIRFTKNKLVGSIPSTIGNLQHLTNLGLGYNRITGTIPSTIGNLRNMTYFGLGYNTMKGTIPSEIGNCKSLQTLSLYFDSLTGTIPTELGSLDDLEELKIEGNKFAGSIPSHLGNCRNMKRIYVTNNVKLTGTVPREFENLSRLEELVFDYTLMSGTIPDTICSLRERNLTRLIPSSRMSCECCTQF